MRRRTRSRRAGAGLAPTVLACALLVGCSQGGNEVDIEVEETSPPAEAEPIEPGDGSTESPSIPPPTGEPEVAYTPVTGLQTPWGLDFLPDGSAIVTERDTKRVLLVKPRGRSGEKFDTGVIGTIDAAVPEGEGGLLGVAVSPAFEQDKLVYFYLTTATDNRVVRAKLKKDRLGETEVLLDGIPRGSTHDGGRLEFGPEGYLYVSTGEAGDPPLAQDPDSLGGKVLRLTPDGATVISSGHRNVQGLAFDDNGRLWASEFGQNTFDELNLIERGSNYGWPEVEGTGGGDEFVDPVQTWETEVASPSGLAFSQGYLYMGALRGERLWRLEVRTKKAVKRKGFFIGDYGRLRTVAAAPDGTIWVTTSNRDGRGDPREGDDRIIAVRP